MESIPMWSHTTDSSCLSRKPVAPTFTSFQIARNWSSSLGDSYPANNTTQSSGLSQLKIKGQVTSNACKQRNPILISQYDLRYMQVAAMAQQSRLSKSNKRYPLTTPLEVQCLKIVNVIANIQGSNKSADNLPKPFPKGKGEWWVTCPDNTFFRPCTLNLQRCKVRGYWKHRLRPNSKRIKSKPELTPLGCGDALSCPPPSNPSESFTITESSRDFLCLELWRRILFLKLLFLLDSLLLSLGFSWYTN